jgi:hypothetical protein
VYDRLTGDIPPDYQVEDELPGTNILKAGNDRKKRKGLYEGVLVWA